jgi:hypothetical protein
VPVVSARQMLTWLDGRNTSAFTNISYSGGVLTFKVAPGSGARGLQAMIPAKSPAGPLFRVTRDGAAVPVSTKTIKGVDYAFVDATAATYTASYAQDTTAPTISAVSAVPHPGGTATVTWTTDEASDSRVSYGTSAGALNQAASDAGLVTSHSLNLTGLAANTDYYFQVRSTDPSGNAAAAPPSPAKFTTPGATLIDTTKADFSAGTATGTSVGATDPTSDGDVTLAPTVGAEFDGTALPAGWTQAQWTPGSGSATVAGGALTLDGTYAGTSAAYPAGRSLEFVATFGNAAFQHVGFGVDYNNTKAWAMFSTGSNPVGLWARSNNGTTQDTQITSFSPTVPHRYRIDWAATTVTFFIDGQQVAQHQVAISDQMRPLASDLNAGGPGVTVDWMRMSPYATTGTFESRVFDGGRAGVDWQTLSATAKTPAGTQVGFQTRTGETATPDASWSAWQTVDAGGGIVNATGRYVQYRATLSTTDATSSPVVERVEIAYDGRPNTAPTAGTVTLSPHVPGTNDKLTATASGFQDADGDQMTMHYAWLKGGSPISGETAQTLDLAKAGNGDHGDTIIVQVFATDGRGGTSATVSDSVTVANTPPQAGSVTLSPADPGRNDTLTAAPSGFGDIDGDQFSYQYQWMRNGATLAGQTGSTLDLASLDGDVAGNTIKVSVTAIDGPGGTSDPATASVTASSRTTLVDTTRSDFGAGTATGAYVGATDTAGDGEVVLAPAIGEDFDGAVLPAGWTQGQWKPGSGSTTIANGALTVDGTYAGAANTSSAGHSLEFVATFGSAGFQHVGLGVDYNGTNAWAMFSTGGGGGSSPVGLWARSNNGTEQNTQITGISPTVPHRYRIDWTATSVTYFIDGQQAAQHSITISQQLRPLVSDYNAGGPGVTVDWMRMSPYAPTGTFDSRVLDGGGTGADWQTVSATTKVPAGTQLGFATRTGETATPDASWSGWQAVDAGGGIASPNGRYIQYRANLSSTDPAGMITPVVERVEVGFDGRANTAPTAGTVTLSPHTPGTSDVLTAAPVGFTDADGDQLTMHYVWLRGVSPITGETGPTLDLDKAGNGDHGDTITVQVYATDGRGGTSTTAVDAVTVANTPPKAGDVTLGPSSPARTDTVTANATGFTDADGDPLTYDYTWTRNGILLGGQTGPSLNLAALGAAGGDQIKVSVTASDGHGGTTAAAVAGATVSDQSKLTDTTRTDFGAGTTTGAYVGASESSGDGEVVLAPTVGEEFDGAVLPAGWTQGQWPSGGSTTVANGALMVDGAYAGTADTYPAGRSMEFVATFGNEGFQHVGFGVDYNNIGAWAMFSTGGGTSPSLPVGLWARTNDGTQQNTQITGIDPTAPHRYRLDWTANTVTFFIDGQQVAQHTITISQEMRPLVSDYNAGGAGVTVDWMRMSPYATTGTFESRVFDGGQAGADWQTLTATPNTSAGTQVAFETRSGATATPDASWSAWQPVAAGGVIASPNGGYLQYRASLSTGDPMMTPSVESVTLSYGSSTNSPPTKGTVSIAPSSPKSRDTLIATPAAFSDPDGDTLTYHYQWSVNSASVSGATNQTFAPAGVRHGDKVAVSVTATDGNGGTSPAATDQVTVANSAPAKGTVAIAPSSPRSGELLTATAAGFSDADSDTLTYHYQWSVNGTQVTGATNQTFAPAGVGHRDKVAVSVTATDSNGGTSAAAGAEVTVANSAPVAGTVAITPSSPKIGNTLTATPAGFSDADKDTLTYDYQWSINGTQVTGATNQTFALAGAANGDKVAVSVTASDGNGGTSPAATDLVTVGNSAPVAGTVAITPSSPKSGDTLTATPVAFNDPDGDTLTYHYQWSVNSAPVSGATNQKFAPAGAGHGDKVAVSVTATDGNGGTSPAASAEVTVANSAPAKGSVAISPTGPTTAATVTATPTGFTDADNDPLAYHYQWSVNGHAIAGATGQTFDLSQPGHGDVGDVVRVDVTATDGDGATSATAGDQITVANSAPTAGTVAITPASPGKTAILTAAVSGYGHLDSDPVTYHYQWWVNGQAIAGATGQTFDLSQLGHGGPGDTVRVEVSATDPQGGRSGAVSAQVTIAKDRGQSNVRVPQSVTLQTLARQGLRLTMNAPSGTHVVDLRLYQTTTTRDRRGRTVTRQVLRLTKQVAVSHGGQLTVRWSPSSRAVAQLRSGRYLLVVRTGPDRRHLSSAGSRVTIRLTANPVKAQRGEAVTRAARLPR